MNIPEEMKLTDEELLELFRAKANGPDGERTDIQQIDRFNWVAEAQLLKAAPIIEAQTRKEEREKLAQVGIPRKWRGIGKTKTEHDLRQTSSGDWWCDKCNDWVEVVLDTWPSTGSMKGIVNDTLCRRCGAFGKREIVEEA